MRKATEVFPDAECWPVGCTIAPDDAKVPETMQDVELATPGAPKSTAAEAAGVDEARNAVLEGENATDCVIVADFVDGHAGMMATSSEMCHVNS